MAILNEIISTIIVNKKYLNTLVSCVAQMQRWLDQTINTIHAANPYEKEDNLIVISLLMVAIPYPDVWQKQVREEM